MIGLHRECVYTYLYIIKLITFPGAALQDIGILFSCPHKKPEVTIYFIEKMRIFRQRTSDFSCRVYLKVFTRDMYYEMLRDQPSRCKF